MKVLLLTQLYSDKPVSGGVRIIWNYSRELARQGAKVYVVTGNIDTDNLPKHPNLKIYKVPFSSYALEPISQDVLKSFFYSIPLILWHRIKIVHMVPVQTPCPFSRFKFGAKFIESAERTWDYNNKKVKHDLARDRRKKQAPTFNLFEKLFLRFSRFFYWLFKINQEYPTGADAFFCRSKSMFDYVKNSHNIKSPLYYVPIGVNTDDFKPSVKQAGDKFVFLATGALSYRKGTHYLIDAYNKFSKKYNNQTELWLIGNSNSEILEELKKRIDTDSIKFIEAVLPNEISYYYDLCDAHISLALIAEPGPLQPNVLEAMASGRPLIISEYGDTRGLDKSGIAITCRPQNIGSVVSAMEKVFLNADLRDRLAKNASKYMKDNFDWKVVTKNCLTYYKELLNGKT
jgi:glycosyltransferase involved in cell wall biosynthesis